MKAAPAALALALSLGGPARGLHAVPPGQEALLQLMAGSARLPPGVRLHRVEVRKTMVVLIYLAADGRRFEISLHHPEDAPPGARRTAKFSLAAANDVPRPLLRALEKSVRTREGPFQWVEVEPAPAPGAPAAAPERPEDLDPHLVELAAAVPPEDVPRRLASSLAQAENARSIGDEADARQKARLAAALLQRLTEEEQARQAALDVARAYGAAGFAIERRAYAARALRLAQERSEAARRAGDQPALLAWETARARALVLAERPQAPVVHEELLAGPRPCALVPVVDDLASMGRFRTAVALAQRVRKRDPACAAAWVAEARWAILAGARPEGLLRVLDQAAQVLPDDPQVALAHAQALARAGRGREARERLLPGISSGTAAAGAVPALAALGGADWEELAARLEALAAARPQDPHLFLVRGQVLYHAGADAAAAESLSRALPALAGEPRLHIYRALALHRAHPFEARAALALAFSLPGLGPDAHWAQAVVTLEQDPRGAIVELERALRLARAAPELAWPSPEALERRLADARACADAERTAACLEERERARRRADLLAWLGLAAAGLMSAGYLLWPRRHPAG